jgi:hypothetical protein
LAPCRCLSSTWPLSLAPSARKSSPQ